MVVSIADLLRLIFSAFFLSRVLELIRGIMFSESFTWAIKLFLVLPPPTGVPSSARGLKI